MINIDKIFEHPVFRESMDRIEILERTRQFCCHGIEHSLDVARIAYISALEAGMTYSKEIIYAAALLHDIGRWEQYESGISHHEASVRLAKEILCQTDFTEKEEKEILEAIHRHREKDSVDRGNLASIIYEADKKSRLCWKCQVYDECYWSEMQKNRRIEV